MTDLISLPRKAMLTAGAVIVLCFVLYPVTKDTSAFPALNIVFNIAFYVGIGSAFIVVLTLIWRRK